MKELIPIHLPDLLFARWCEQNFSINRGVYNTIDEKLYTAGYQQVTERRTAIVTFLQNHVDKKEEIKFYKFGHGNLADALKTFKFKGEQECQDVI